MTSSPGVRRGVRVSVVLPGLVDTGIFATARDLAGVERNQQFIAFPRYNRVIWRLHRLMPSVMAPVINPMRGLR